MIKKLELELEQMLVQLDAYIADDSLAYPTREVGMRILHYGQHDHVYYEYPNHEHQPTIIAYRHIVVYGALYQHRAQGDQGRQEHSEKYQKVKLLLIGIGKLKEPLEHLKVYNVAAFYILFFQKVNPGIWSQDSSPGIGKVRVPELPCLLCACLSIL